MDSKGLDFGCYFSVAERASNEKKALGKVEKFILEIVPSQYDYFRDTFRYHDDDFASFKTHYEPLFDRSTIYVDSIIVEFKDTNFSELTSIDDHVGYYYCVTQRPMKNSMIDLTQLDTNLVIRERSSFVKGPELIKKYVRKKPENLTENQHYFEGINWTVPKTPRWKQLPSYTIRMLQTKLKELGYNVDANNLMDEKTKIAIADFQEKNELWGHRIWRDTVRTLLGID